MQRADSLTHVDHLMAEASEALVATEYARAERLAAAALTAAWAADGFGHMARIALPLQEARRQRTLQAFDAARESGLGVRVLDFSIEEETEVSAGCWLVQPPFVGADARRLRAAALRQDQPVATMTREPLTRQGRCPIVAVGAVVARTTVDPSPTPIPDLVWFAAAIEALGDSIIAASAAEEDLRRRVEYLLQRLEALPEHEKLHQALAETCRLAERAQRDGTLRKPTPESTRDDTFEVIADEDA